MTAMTSARARTTEMAPNDEDWWRDDEGYDFPRAKHPGREAFTFCLVAMVFLGLIGWGLWALAWRALGVWG